jgi:hypothetical protein
MKYDTIIKDKPIIIPGIIPARNRLPIETLPITPYKTNGILGGIMTPIAPAEAVNAAANPLPYFSLSIAGIINDPIAATVAGPDPEIAAKNIQVSTVTIAKPPIIKPTNELAKARSLFETPPFPIKIPAIIKNGMAIIGKESRDVNTFCVNVITGIPSVKNMTVIKVERPIAIPIGMLNAMNKNRDKNSTIVVNFPAPLLPDLA